MTESPRDKMLGDLQRHRQETPSSIARRSVAVTIFKALLPLAAAGVLIALVVSPYWRAGPDADRVTYHIPSVTSSSTASQMQGAEYHGVDQQGQPYTLTADSAAQQGADGMSLVNPEGDLTLKDGAWLMLKSATGLFHQKSEQLGLNGGVTLYRNDGTTMTVASTVIDMKAGTATSTDPVQAQGPFGTLHADNGFTLLNRGTDITFNGPVAMTLTGAP